MFTTMKLFSLGVIIANVITTPIVVVDAFSGVMKNQQTRTQTRSRQPSQQPSSPLLPPLAYLMREGDNEFDDNGNSNSNNESTTKKKRRMTLSIGSIIPTSTGGIKATGTINLNLKKVNTHNYVVEEKAMIDDLQNQHLQMMQMQQQSQQKHQSSSLSLLYSATTPPTISYVYAPSSGAPTLTTGTAIIPPSSMTMRSARTITAATTNNNNVNVGSGIYDKLHDDLNQLNIQLLRSKVSFIRRLLPKNKKQYIERFVDFMIKFIL